MNEVPVQEIPMEWWEAMLQWFLSIVAACVAKAMKIGTVMAIGTYGLRLYGRHVGFSVKQWLDRAERDGAHMAIGLWRGMIWLGLLLFAAFV